MSRVNLLGQSNPHLSSDVSVEDTINFWVETKDSEETPIILHPTPGTKLFARWSRNTYGTGISNLWVDPISGAVIFEAQQSLHVWFGATYDSDYPGYSAVDTSYSFLEKGSVLDIAFIPDGQQPGKFIALVLCTGAAYIMYHASHQYLLAEVVDTDFPTGATTCCTLGHRFIVNDPSNPGRFYVSTALEIPAYLVNGSGWTSTMFATAEARPDTIRKLFVDHTEMWIFGEDSTEVWYDAGTENVPFQPALSQFIEWGCSAPRSVAKIGNSVFFLSKNHTGQGLVMSATPGSAKVVSASGVTKEIAGYSKISDAHAFTFQWHGHMFYAITFPTADKTWLYNITNNTWTRWSTNGGKHFSSCYAFIRGKHVVGSSTQQALFYLSEDSYKDADYEYSAAAKSHFGFTDAEVDGYAIHRTRKTNYLHSDGNWVVMDALEILAETGIGDADDDTTAEIMLRWSDDGGHTWSNWHYRTLGALGEYRHRAVWRRIGRTRRRVFEIKFTENKKCVIYGAYLKTHPGGRQI